MGIAWNGVTGRTLLAGLCGGGAALAAGVFAALVYAIGYGVETGGTYTAPGDDMDFTGWPSLIFAIPCGATAFPFLAGFLFQRAGITPMGEIVLPAVVVTLVLAFDLLLRIPVETLIPATGPAAAVFAFAAMALTLDRRAPTPWRATAAVTLLTSTLTALAPSPSDQTPPPHG
ncbi:hypothetical protein [Actinocorallia lasiicapitis]